jgi:hypothetical protein
MSYIITEVFRDSRLKALLSVFVSDSQSSLTHTVLNFNAVRFDSSSLTSYRLESFYLTIRVGFFVDSLFLEAVFRVLADNEALSGVPRTLSCQKKKECRFVNPGGLHTPQLMLYIQALFGISDWLSVDSESRSG